MHGGTWLLTLRLAQPLLCNITQKNGRNKFQNCSCRDDDVTNYVNFFEKLCKKWLKYVFFLVKSTLRQPEKRFSRSFFSF